MRGVTVFWIDGIKPGRLGIGPCPFAEDFPALRSDGVDIVVSLLEERGDEPDHCEANDLAFLWHPIHDGGVPESADDLIRRIVGDVRRGESVFIHCLGGIGRSSTVAAAVLVRMGDTPEGAFERISAARGLTVPETSEQRDWVREFARRR